MIGCFYSINEQGNTGRFRYYIMFNNRHVIQGRELHISHCNKIEENYFEDELTYQPLN